MKFRRFFTCAYNLSIFFQIYSTFPKQAKYMTLTGLNKVSDVNHIMSTIENMTVVSKFRKWKILFEII